MSEKSKKRKRLSSDQHLPSNKKVAATKPPSDITVKYLSLESRAPHVIIASAPGLDIPRNSRFLLSQRRKEHPSGKSRTAANSRQSNEHEYMLSASKDTLEYTGCEDRVSRDENKLKSYVGVYDPASGELQIMEACKMELRVSLRDCSEATNDELKTPRQTNGMLRRELGLEFGTKKARKAIESSAAYNTPATARSTFTTSNADKNNDDDDNDHGASQTQTESYPPSTQKSLRHTDPLAAAILESMDRTEAHLPTREDMQAESDAAKPRPRANLDAQTRADVYPVESLVAEEELCAMIVKDWLDAVRNGQEVMQSSKFVARRLIHVAQKDDVQSLRLLKYISTLRDFYAALKPQRGGGRKLPIREQLKNKTAQNNYILDSILRRFTNGREMTKWHVDYFMTHVFAMTLLVDMYETDTSDIREDFQLDTKQAHQYFRELGCRVKPPTESDRMKLNIKSAESSMHHIARLKLPLTFPKTRVMPMNKRR